MLPFDRKPWAKQLARSVIILTLICAVLAFLYLRHIRHLDPPMIVLILLLLLAIIPPNILILRRHSQEEHSSHSAGPVYASRPSGR